MNLLINFPLLAILLSTAISFSEGFSAPVPTSTSNANEIASSPKTIAVVGGGVGGLATAARIASSPDLPPSSRVILVEKNSKDMVGGRCGSFHVDVEGLGTFRHERGPSLLLLKDVYLDLFRDCGKDVQDYGLEIVQCKPAYQCVFEDGESIMLGFPYSQDEDLQHLEKLSREQMNGMECDGAEKWDEYMRTSAAFLDCGLPNFIEEKLELQPFPAFVNEAVKGGFKAWPLKPHSAVLDEIFESDKMRALASFQDLYVGLEPYANKDQIAGGIIKKTAPAVFGLLAAIELHPTNKRAGVYAPIGGFKSVGDAFEKLAVDCGVEIQYEKTVTSLGKKGVWYIDSEGNSNVIPADLIICNADLPFSTETLIHENENDGNASLEVSKSLPRYDFDDKFDYSSGVIAFHWSLNKRCDVLNTHNVFLMGGDREKAEKSWSAVRNNDQSAPSFHEKDYPFNFYVHRASAVDTTAAPEDCDAIMVLVPCPTLKRDKSLAQLDRDEAIEEYTKQFDESFISKVRDAALHRLGLMSGLEDLKDHIVDEVVDSPATYASNYNLAAGTPFALSHGFGQLSLTRPAHQSQSLDNLLFVGASTRPGNGVPLVLLGAKQVAEKAIKRCQKQATTADLFDEVRE